MLNPIGKYFKILLLWNIRIIWKQAWLECSLYGYLQNVCFCVNPSPKNVKMSTTVGHHSTNMGPYGKIIFKNSLIDINLSMYNHLIVPYKISIFVFKCWNMKLLLKKTANLFEPKLTSIFYWQGYTAGTLMTQPILPLLSLFIYFKFRGYKQIYLVTTLYFWYIVFIYFS